jgi:hypothetical protein
MTEHSATEETVTKRRFRTWMLVLCGFVVLIVVTVVSFAGWRQHRINNAFDELRTEYDAAASVFSHVEDWDRWYRGRVERNWGGDVYETLAQYASENWSYDDDRILMAENWLSGYGPEHPDLRQAEEFITETDEYAARMRQLLRYDDLAILPSLTDDGWWARPVLPIVLANQILVTRACCFALLNQPDDAWREWQLLVEHNLRRHAFSCRVDHATHNSWVRQAHRLFARLATLYPLPEYASSYLPASWPEPDWASTVEGELALYAQAAALDQTIEPTQLRWAGIGGGSGYGHVRDWLLNPEKYVQWMTEEVRGLRMLHEFLRQGGTLRDYPGYADTSFSERVLRSNAMRAMSALEVNLVYKLRRAEAEGVPLAEFEAPGEQYGQVTIERAEDGRFKVTWEPSESVMRRLAEDYVLTPYRQEPRESIYLKPLD